MAVQNMNAATSSTGLADGNMSYMMQQANAMNPEQQQVRLKVRKVPLGLSSHNVIFYLVMLWL